eukprot:2498962-Prymnesium_polylepis.1
MYAAQPVPRLQTSSPLALHPVLQSQHDNDAFGRRPPRSAHRHHLRFVNAREQGGFDEAANVHVPKHAHGSWLEYSLGYRHMV